MNGLAGSWGSAMVAFFFAWSLPMTLWAQDADLVAVGGRVWTGDTEHPWAEAVAVREGAILAVGSDGDIRRLVGAATRVVELGGRFAMPGFIDAHTHFIDGGFRLSGVDLRDADTPEEFARRLSGFAARLEEGEWILGGDWDHERWGGELPDRSWIDEATANHPVFVSRLDGHMALANARALELAGIEPTVEVPRGGEIVRDPAGRLTGIFKDEAMGLVSEHIPPPTAGQRDEALRRAMRHAASVGVTAVQDMGSWADLETYRRAHARGDLTLRVYAFVPLATWQKLADEVRGGWGDDPWLRIGGLKGFVDGSLGSGTALFAEPYEGEPANRGLLVTPIDSLREQIAGADRAGLQVAVHAIGDSANALLLDLFEDVMRTHGPRDRRARIEHAQHLRPRDINRFSALGVIASMQPYHAIDDGRWAEKKIGSERGRHTYAFRSLLDGGAEVALGSDWTVAPLSPLLGVYAAVTRRTLDGANPGGWVPEQRISVEEALVGYTRSAAYAGFAETVTGSLEPGKLADFVVLDEDPFSADPGRIQDIQVELTVVGGRVVYERGAGGDS